MWLKTIKSRIWIFFLVGVLLGVFACSHDRTDATIAKQQASTVDSPAMIPAIVKDTTPVETVQNVSDAPIMASLDPKAPLNADIGPFMPGFPGIGGFPGDIWGGGFGLDVPFGPAFGPFPGPWFPPTIRLFDQVSFRDDDHHRRRDDDDDRHHDHHRDHDKKHHHDHDRKNNDDDNCVRADDNNCPVDDDGAPFDG